MIALIEKPVVLVQGLVKFAIEVERENCVSGGSFLIVVLEADF